MRRALLTAKSVPPGPPVSIGNPAVAGSSAAVQRLLVDKTTPATATSTITTVNLYAYAAGTIYVMTGAATGTNYVVRSISAALTAVVGANAFAVSLPVVAGDYIATWTPSGGAILHYNSSTGSLGYNTSSPTTLPTPGSNLPFSVATGKIALGGTG